VILLSRKGTKTITVDETFYEKLQRVADRNNMYVNELVKEYFIQGFPGDFQESQKVIV
jgi:predicted DNA-binding ribbon-helix-helix protein